MGKATEHRVSLVDPEVLVRNEVTEFAQWFEREWRHDNRESWEKEFDEPYPGDQYRDAYNEGVSSVLIALEWFLDDLACSTLPDQARYNKRGAMLGLLHELTSYGAKAGSDGAECVRVRHRRI